MIDPLSAVGLASSIVQFVDFGSKLLLEGYNVYKSEQGASKESLEIEGATIRLQELSQRLSAPRRGATSKDEAALYELAVDCRALTQELLNMLEELKVTGSGPLRSWETVSKTIRRHFKADVIERLQRRLDKARGAIGLHLLAILADENFAVMTSLHKIEMTSKQMHFTELGRIDLRSSELLAAVRDQNRTTQLMAKSVEMANQDHLVAMQQLQTSLLVLADRLTALQQEGAAIMTSQRILDSLAFDEMEDREDQIHKQYHSTFSWGFDETQTPFKTWLSDMDGVFWISGKAGSGKSTLMKFLANHRNTDGALHHWAACKGKQLVKASFYFWNAGRDMQKSQQGLLQSLVHQTFRQCPELIALATPEKRWGANDSFGRSPKPWELDELLDTIQNFVRLGDASSKAFCFFVDGLDEYTGDHSKLIEVLGYLSESAWIKLCVSSRPWTVFNNAYARYEDRKLVVQDLTRPDMDVYISGMLEDDNRFKALVREDPRAWRLVSEIRDRAEGVFLWVFLVVRRLLVLMEEINMGKNRLDTLESALRALPSDLERYFRHMIDTIEEAHRTHTAGTFKLAIHSTPLPLIAFWYLPVVLKQPNDVIRAPIEYDEDDDEFITKTTQSINAWCKDLLEVHKVNTACTESSGLSFKIDFLHRTVRDFLVTNADVQTIFSDHLQADFDPGMTLMRLHLAQVKALYVKSGSDQDLRIFTSIASDFMSCAREYERKRKAVEPVLYSEFDRVGTHFRQLATQGSKPSLLSAGKKQGPTHWTNACSMNRPNYCPGVARARGDCTFLAYAVAHDLVLFVKHALSTTSIELEGETGAVLLNHALHPLAKYPTLDHKRMPSYDMVLLLLQGGANANVRTNAGWTGGHTSWELFLRRCDHSPNLKCGALANRATAT